MSKLILNSPLAGWVMPLAEIPDPVFAQGMVGDGVGIDPTGNTLHAPCAGRVVMLPRTGHALTLRTVEGVEVLLHLGIDTVTLEGAGFEPLVAVGDDVASGQALLRFDLDLIARRARSAVTPVLLASGGKVVRVCRDQLVAVGEFLMEIDCDVGASPERAPSAAGSARRRRFQMHFEHGLHARPASLLVAALRPFVAKVTLTSRAGEANARSAVAMMALGVQRDEFIEFSALGADADAALDALAGLLVADAAAAQAVVAPESMPDRLIGIIASRGLALGEATPLRPAPIEIAETATDPAHERERLGAAIAAVHAQIVALAESQQGAQRHILAAHAELVEDPELLEQAQSHIDRGSSAGHGWRQAIAASTRALARLDDARMRERIADLRDIEYQVQRALVGKAARSRVELPEHAILLADELLPSQLLGLDRERLAGICTARGGPTSHVAIIAAALGIPALVATGPRVLEIAAGSTVLLDAERGFLKPAPSDQEQWQIREDLVARQRQHASDMAAAVDRCNTRDGVAVAVFANLGAVADAAIAVARGADGCGLLRTEFLYLDRRSPPDEDEQFEEYRKILDVLAPRPLTIRTMDIGGDKPIPYLSLPAEENPALGLRGLRTSFAQPELLRSQLRAILRLRSPGTCRVLLPMVTEVGELRAVRKLLQDVGAELGLATLPKLGAMIETPASALLADQLLAEADFLSIGTNDLSQYVLAMDRGHPMLAARLDALHPAVLRLIASVAAAGHAREREVAVCGGLGSDPDAIALLIGLGIREISAVPGTIPAIKRIVRSLDAGACGELARRAMDLEDAVAVRRLVVEWSVEEKNSEKQR